MSLNLVTVSEVQTHYDFLNTCGFIGKDQGYLRAAYSDEETQAMLHFAQWAHPKGAVSEWDPIKNKIITFNPDSKPADCYIEFISHLDTVPGGGNFDGAAGIVAAVLASEKLIKNKLLPKGVGARVRIFRGEESGTFGVAYIGSLAAAGMLDPVHLEKSFGGQRLRDAMERQQANVNYIIERRPTLPIEQLDTILYSDELHIEQGPILIGNNIDVGIVTSIRGAIRLVYEFKGEDSHSGTTPLNMRKDTLKALGPIITEFDNFLEQRLEKFPVDKNPAHDLIATITEITGGVGPSSVCGRSTMRIDLRGVDISYMNQCIDELTLRLNQVASSLNLGFAVRELSRTQPVSELDLKLQQAKVTAASNLSLSSLLMPSGAGHDSAVVALRKRSNGSKVPVGMVFIPCEGLSHYYTEVTAPESIAAGASHMIESAVIYASQNY